MFEKKMRNHPNLDFVEIKIYTKVYQFVLKDIGGNTIWTDGMTEGLTDGWHDGQPKSSKALL